jgi:uncharacterized membrane protein
MDVTAIPLSWPWVVASWLLAVPLLVWAVRVAPWARFADGVRVHVCCGAIVVSLVLWSLRATVGDGFTFHLLGAAALTLVVRAPLALIGAAVIVGVSIGIDGGLWRNAAIAFLSLGALPVAVTHAVLRFTESRLPPNFFVYVFVAAYLGAGLSIGAGGIVGATALWLGGGRPAALVFGEYAPWLIYLGFAEAMLTGMIVTLAVVYRPQWVATFDDRRYIVGR